MLAYNWDKTLWAFGYGEDSADVAMRERDLIDISSHNKVSKYSFAYVRRIILNLSRVRVVYVPTYVYS